MKYIVYCTTCTANGKIYIGVHKTENPDIFDGYIGNGIEVGWNIKNPTTVFQHALKKYGYSKFKRATLYVFDNENQAYNKEAEIVTLDFIRRRDNYNTAVGGKHPGAKYKTLYQYDLQGNFLSEWFSVQETCKHFNCYDNRFNIVIKDKRSAFNSYWSYEKVNKLDISKYRLSQHSETYQYDSIGNLLKIYDSIKSIQLEYPELTKQTLCDARAKKCLVNGYYWVAADVNIINIIKTRELLDTLSDKSVTRYKNGIKVKTYSRLSQAAKENNTTTTQIKKSIKNGEGNWSYGYSDTYHYNPVPIPIQVEQYDKDGNLVKIWDSIAQCTKEFKEVRSVLRGRKKHIKGYTFKLKLS